MATRLPTAPWLRQETLDPRPGAARLARPRHVVVVGGGLAGCAAATILAERGARVTVIEREGHLGGRVGAWKDTLADGTPIQMERGFHAFFRQYYNLRALLRRFDPNLARLLPLEDYPLLGPNGYTESFAGLPRSTPANLIALVHRTPTLDLRDLARVDRMAALEMLRYEPDRTYARYDHRTAAEYLDSLRFPPRARQMLFEVFAHSFFNPQDAMSAAELLRMFHFYFTGNREGLVFDVLDQPFSSGLWDPWQAYLERRGVTFHTSREVRSVTPRDAARDGAGFHVKTAGRNNGVDPADAVVLAVTVGALKRLVDASPAIGDPAWRHRVAGLALTRPFVIWRRWLDRLAAPHRAPFAGTAGLGLLDNVSLYERFQDEARGWARRTGGSVIELHAYAVPEGVDDASVRADLWHQALALYPELRAARVIDERYRRDQDCPGFPPGARADRPGVATPTPGLTLAGDFVRLPVPCALMEGAVTSGLLAANALLEGWGVAGEPVLSIPRTGMLTPGMLTAMLTGILSRRAA